MKSYLSLTILFASGALIASSAVTGELLPRHDGVAVATDRGTLRVTPVTDDIFRITVEPEAKRAFTYLPSQSAILKTQQHDVRVAVSPEKVELISPTTTLVIDRSTGLVNFYNAKGDLLVGEAAGVDNRGETKRATFTTPDGQKFFGAGERGHSFTLNGDSLPMYNRATYGYTEGDPRISQMNITIPYVVSDKGYGILFDDHNKAMLTVADTISYTSPNPAGELSYYFINGNGTMAGTTANYTRLTGRQELPPFWSLGYITSKYGYHNRQETLGAVDSLKRAGYPVDGIVLDLYWYGKETDMGRLEWDKNQFPDHRQMLDSLRSRGVKTVLITQPYINKIGALDNYNLLDSLGLLTHDAQGRTNDVTTWVGEAGMFDVSNPATRDWYWNRYRALTEEGVEGWWGDLGEPEVHPQTIVHANGMTADQYHNVYGNEWSRIIYEGFKKDFPEKRLMAMMRGGTAGLQRYSVFPWTGDVSRSWGGFIPQIKLMLNMGLSGLGYLSSDIGGFAVDPKHPTDPELYVRWLQMGAFTPTLRTHAQLAPEPYHYPQQQKITLDYIKQRYQWLPYNYTLAYENAAKGLPLVRPLDFRSEGKATHADVTDEYLWGDEVLVAPVFKKGARSRRVAFPAGEWIDWNNPSRRYRGGTTANVAAPLEKMPLFVKAGSFIPQYDRPIEHTGQYDPKYLTVKYFPSAETTSYTLYDDDRVSPASLSDGRYQLITFTGSKERDTTRIELRTEGAGYAGMPAERDITLEVVGLSRVPKSVEAGGEPLSGWRYDAKKKTLTVPFSYSGTSLALTIR